VAFELRDNKIVFDADEELWIRSNDNVFELNPKNINRFSSFGLGKDNRYFWSNKVMSWYYGKEYLIFIPSDLYQNVYASTNLITDQNILKLPVLKNVSDSLKIYKTAKNNLLVYNLSDSISKEIGAGAYVKYSSNKPIAPKLQGGLINTIKSKIIGKKPILVKEQTTSCYVLPTKTTNFLILNSPSDIPFNNLEVIEIFATEDATTPVLSF
jgi:hypothetical protein